MGEFAWYHQDSTRIMDILVQLNINFLNIEILKNYYEFTIDEASELLKSGIIRKSRRLTTEELQQYGLKNNE